MSEPQPEQPFYKIPVIGVPRYVPLTVTPKDGQQPFIIAACGHKVWRLQDLSSDEKSERHNSSPHFPNFLRFLPPFLRPWVHRIEKCDNCLLQGTLDKTTRCFNCKQVILVGQSVWCAFPLEPPDDFVPTDFTRTPIGFVGCMSQTCCPTGGLFSGYWDGEGITSPVQTGTAAGDALSTNQVVHGVIG